jgi:G3E family GTPase
LDDSSIPVALVTGALGAGKTTLLNRVLESKSDRRIAVIQNEYGDVPVDSAVLDESAQTVVDLCDGRVCCSLRGQLIGAMQRLRRVRERLDGVLMETTGVADPTSVLQSFLLDYDIARAFKLDTVVCVVDAKHAPIAADAGSQWYRQLRCADRVVLNKCDLVEDARLSAVGAAIRRVNPHAECVAACHADIPVKEIFGDGSFDLQRLTADVPSVFEPTYPFDWAGLACLEQGEYRLRAQQGAFPQMSLCLVPVPCPTENALLVAQDAALRQFSDPPVPLADGDVIEPGPTHWRLELDNPSESVRLEMSEPGTIAVVAEHSPKDFPFVICDSEDEWAEWVATSAPRGAHRHDEAIETLTFSSKRPFDVIRLRRWLRYFLIINGHRVLRVKGAVSTADDGQRWRIDGVRTLLDAVPIARRGMDGESHLVVIGQELPAQLIERSLAACQV